MDLEKDAWESFLLALIQDNINVYVKGGSVLGMQLLSVILFRYPNNETAWNLFLKLNLIKDFDFYVTVPSDEEKKRVVELATIRGFRNEGHTITLIRYHNYQKIDDDALFECSIKINDGIYSDLSEYEVPLTALSIPLTCQNLNSFFKFAHIYFTILTQKLEPDLEELLTLLKLLPVLEPKITTFGLFQTDKLHTGQMNSELISFIHDFASNYYPMNKRLTTIITQFLISQLIQPDRLFMRFMGKNLPKSQKIQIFCDKIYISYPSYLLDPVLQDIIQKFITELVQVINLPFTFLGPATLEHDCKLVELFKAKSKPSLTKRAKGRLANEENEIKNARLNFILSAFISVSNFFDGVNLGRLAGLLPQFTLESQQLVLLFLPPVNTKDLQKLGKRKGMNTSPFLQLALALTSLQKK